MFIVLITDLTLTFVISSYYKINKLQLYIIPSSSVIENQIQLIYDILLWRLLYLGACPNQAEEEQQFAMKTSEPVRLQLDNLQKENHELQVRILKVSQTKPDAKAITEIETERDHWKEKYEGVVIENSQLEALYEKLLESTKGTSPVACDEGPQSIFELQEQLHQEVEAAQQ